LPIRRRYRKRTTSTSARAANGVLGTMLGYGLAFALLTWPLLWLVVGYVRYVITGQPLGR
jgi:hypothetical protein